MRGSGAPPNRESGTPAQSFSNSPTDCAKRSSLSLGDSGASWGLAPLVGRHKGTCREEGMIPAAICMRWWTQKHSFSSPLFSLITNSD